MKDSRTFNTYLSIDLFVYKNDLAYLSRGHIYTNNESAKLDLHVDVDYRTAKRELAKLMLRTGRMPEIHGKNDHEMTMYSLRAFPD